MRSIHDRSNKPDGRLRSALLGATVALLLVGPMAAPAATGQELIGTVEGPTTIVDPAQFPTEFNQAPELAALVASGDLPPIEERLPVQEDLLVIEPLNEIGTYSDRPLRRVFTGPGDHWNGKRAAARDTILFFNPDMSEAMPNVAKSIEASEDGTTYTITLRRGMKWSDGHPFTADDFVFWYEHIFKHPELGNSNVAVLSVDGEAGTVEKIDDVTVRYTLPQPNYLFPEMLAGFQPMSTHGTWGFSPGGGGFAPAHYLEQFHPDFASEEELAAAVAESGLENWTLLFANKNDWSLNPDLPTVTPYKSATAANTELWVLERNPYYFGVDTQGNQLPYINEIVHKLIGDVEAVNFEALSGSVDFQGRHLDLRKLPLFLENQEQGGYKVYFDPQENGGAATLAFNMSYDADPVIADLFAQADFRRALSLGIQREQINETFLLGVGIPGSIVPADGNPYNPGPEYRGLWATYDPETANAMLDELGLTDKDAEGYRLRPDGQRLRIEIGAVTGSFIPATDLGEMIRQHWAEIGIDANILQMDRTLYGTRNEANQNQMVIWNNGNSDQFYGAPFTLFPHVPDSYMGPLWGAWYQSNGEQGIEPPEEMKTIMAEWTAGPTLPTAEERYEVGKRTWATMADQVWVIGLVGVTPAGNGMRIAKTDLGNVPSRQLNNVDAMTPGLSRLETFYWK